MRNTVADLTRWIPPVDSNERGESVRSRVEAVVPVLHRGQVMGVIRPSALAADLKTVPAAALAEPTPCVLPHDTAIPVAAQLMAQGRHDFALVTEGDKYVGMVSAADFLGEVGRAWDPLTGLPMSDALQQWGEAQLAARTEIAIIFVDLNDFGLYNKRHGHVVGDRVLKAVAERLRERTNPATDLLVRFGGDEFAIGTTRIGEDAEDLAASLREPSITVVGVPEGVRFSVGVAGGRRTHGRPVAHQAANLDDLVNKASRDCLAQKKRDQQPSPDTLHDALTEVLKRTDLGRGEILDAAMIQGPAGEPMVQISAVQTPNSQPRMVRRVVNGNLLLSVELALRDALRQG